MLQWLTKVGITFASLIHRLGDACAFNAYCKVSKSSGVDVAMELNALDNELCVIMGSGIGYGEVNKGIGNLLKVLLFAKVELRLDLCIVNIKSSTGAGKEVISKIAELPIELRIAPLRLVLYNLIKTVMLYIMSTFSHCCSHRGLT